jgi:hypothetical protein
MHHLEISVALVSLSLPQLDPDIHPSKERLLSITSIQRTAAHTFSAMSAEDGVPVTIEFTLVDRIRHRYLANSYSGGLEILFGNQKKYSITLPTKDELGAPANVAFLVRYLCDKLMKDPRKELFILDDTV